MYNRKDVKRFAAKTFTANYWPFVGVCVLFDLLAGVANSVPCGSLLLLGSLTVGLNMYSLRRWRGENPTIDQAFSDGFSRFGHVLGGWLWMFLFSFLWTLLFIIPGIVKGFSYAMTTYILGDCPNVSPKDALKLSMRMMKGHKWELFMLHLSFLGWHLLSILTCGLLYIFYVGPYFNAACAGYYAIRKEQALADGTITAEELAGAPLC